MEKDKIYLFCSPGHLKNKKDFLATFKHLEEKFKTSLEENVSFKRVKGFSCKNISKYVCCKNESFFAFFDPESKEAITLIDTKSQQLKKLLLKKLEVPRK
jgi:hypothetical protein